MRQRQTLTVKLSHAMRRLGWTNIRARGFLTTMSKTARLAKIAAIIELLCGRFPRTFSRCGPQPLKVGVYGDVLAALGEAVQPRDLQSALRAYTSNAGYLRALLAGACRIDLDGKPAGTVTPEDEAVGKVKLVEFKNARVPASENAACERTPARASSAGVGPQATRDETHRGKPEAVRAQKAVARRLARGRAAATGGWGVSLFSLRGAQTPIGIGVRTEIRRL
jgi:ProP effector